MFVPSFIALSMSSALATPSCRRLNASFIIGTRSRFTTNPGDSLTSTGSFPSFTDTPLIRATVIARLRAADHLDELHDRRRVEEVHPDDAVRALCRVRHLRDAQGRRVRCEHHIR